MSEERDVWALSARYDELVEVAQVVVEAHEDSNPFIGYAIEALAACLPRPEGDS